MLGRPPTLFTSPKAWAVGYLSAALAVRGEPYAAGVPVRTEVGDSMPASLVTVRDDGGPRGEATTRTASLGFNVWAGSDADAEDLALLVAALFEASPGNGPVVAHTGTFGPYEVPEPSGKPHYYLSVDLVVTGSPLNP